AVDPFGNTDTNYQGTITFTTSDTDPGVVLPAVYTFTVGDGRDNGVHTFADAVTLVTGGEQTLTATDTASGIPRGATAPATSLAAPPGGRGRQSAQQIALLDRLFGSLVASASSRFLRWNRSMYGGIEL